MKKMKLSGILALGLFPLLMWPLALSSAYTPIVAHYGMWGCITLAGVVACVSSYLIVTFVQEL